MYQFKYVEIDRIISFHCCAAGYNSITKNLKEARPWLASASYEMEGSDSDESEDIVGEFYLDEEDEDEILIGGGCGDGGETNFYDEEDADDGPLTGNNSESEMIDLETRIPSASPGKQPSAFRSTASSSSPNAPPMDDFCDSLSPPFSCDDDDDDGGDDNNENEPSTEYSDEYFKSAAPRNKPLPLMSPPKPRFATPSPKSKTQVKVGLKLKSPLGNVNENTPHGGKVNPNALAIGKFIGNVTNHGTTGEFDGFKYAHSSMMLNVSRIEVH